jgi:hypothetical protein
VHFSFNFHSFPDRQAGRSLSSFKQASAKAIQQQPTKQRKSKAPPQPEAQQKLQAPLSISYIPETHNIHTPTQDSSHNEHVSATTSAAAAAAAAAGRQASKQASTTQPREPRESVHQPTQQQQAAPRSRPPSKRNQYDKEKQQI